ncbi:MAG: hypothetical protein ACSLEN_14230 [Candidatus Malihini olakiniferum]
MFRWVARLERKNLKDQKFMRHGDVAIAGSLANYAALNLSLQIEFQAPEARDASISEREMTDTGFGLVRGMNNFGEFI